MRQCTGRLLQAIYNAAMSQFPSDLPHINTPCFQDGCVLCHPQNEEVVYQGTLLRIIRAHEANFPAFYRVIWTSHVAEWTDLSASERNRCMEAVALVEQALRDVLAPTKVNLATLGNMVAHLHWHVIARFEWDSHFPAPVWAQAQAETVEHAQVRKTHERRIEALLPQVNAAIVSAAAAVGY